MAEELRDIETPLRCLDDVCFRLYRNIQRRFPLFNQVEDLRFWLSFKRDYLEPIPEVGTVLDKRLSSLIDSDQDEFAVS